MKTATLNENSQERRVLLVWFVRSKMKPEREEEAQDRKTSNGAPHFSALYPSSQTRQLVRPYQSLTHSHTSGFYYFTW